MYGLRYVRNNVESNVMKSIIQAQVVSRLSYGAVVWSQRLSCALKVSLKSTYYRILRVITRDFDIKYNRGTSLLMTGQEDINAVLFKRTSVEFFSEWLVQYNLLIFQLLY